MSEYRDLWALDPAITYLNHGAFGAAPRPVLEAQDRVRAELESDPTAFYVHTFDRRLAEVREYLATFLRADPEGLAFVTNATAGMQSVLASLAPRAVVATDHVYVGIRRQLERSGARVTEVAVPLEAPAAPVLDAITDDTDLVVVDQIASPTTSVFPVAEIVRGAHERGVPVLVDAAHAPGMFEIDHGADFWTGNLHKWCCAPKAAAVLHVAPAYRDRIRPPITSNLAGQGFLREFDWQGVVDLTALLAAPTAIDLLGGIGWESIRARNSALARDGAALVAETIGTSSFHAEGVSMALVDPGPDLSYDEGLALHRRLYDEHRIQVPLTWWRERAWLRLSAQLYNELADYERLAELLRPNLIF